MNYTSRPRTVASIWLLVIVAIVSLSGGIAEGGEWVHMKHQSPDQRIVSLLPMPGGELWAATDNEFYHYDGAHWRILEGVRAQFQYPVPFISDDAGNVYILDRTKLAVLSGSVVRWYDNAGAQAPVTGAFDGDGTLYLTSNHLTGKGIYAFDGETVTRIHETRAVSVTVDQGDRVWATVRDSETDEMQLVCRESGVWTDRTGDVGDHLFPVTYKDMTVRTAPDGAVWVNNRGKYAVLRDGVWSFGGSGGTPLFIDFDSSGGVWGYNASSLYLLNANGTWDVSRQVVLGPTVMPQFMAETSGGGLWITDEEFLYRYADGIWSRDVSPYDLASDVVTSMAFNHDGLLFCGHAIRYAYEDNDDLGLSMWDGTQWFNTNQFGTRVANNVYHLETTMDGTVVAYTEAGFFEYNHNTWTVIDSLNTVVENSVVETDMTWEDYDTLWLSTDSGLVRYNKLKSPSLVLYLPPDGGGKPKPAPLYSVTIGSGDLVYCQNLSKDILSFDERDKIWETVIGSDLQTHDFEIDGDDVIWGARDMGLAYWDIPSREWEVVTPLSDARKLDIDAEGRIWVSGNGETGYYSGNAWHGIPELGGIRAADFAFSESGEVALNALDYAQDDTYAGMYIYLPQTGVADSAPEPVAIETVNVPNPFNPVTSIRFRLPEAAHAEIAVYSAMGQKVRSLGSGWYPAGWNSVIWDAHSDDGARCSSGMYFYRIVMGKTAAAGKMLLLR